MKTTKIYLQYPWKFPDSPYYKYLLKEVPKEREYQNASKQKGVITKERFFWFSNFLKKNIRKYTRILFPSMLNAHLSPKGNYDVIHCAHCLSKNKNEPWIADFEAFWQLWVSTKKTKRGLREVEKILKKDNCKKILPWTQKVYDEFILNFPFLKDKMEIVFPSVPLMIKKKQIKNKVTLIFSGRYFYQKGGFHALKAIERLIERNENVDAFFNSVIPEEIRKKYSKNKKIKFYGLIPQKKLFELYQKADISIHPGYSDSFGYAFLETMSFGIPIITVDGDSRRELIQDGKNGFVIERPKNFSCEKLGKTENDLINNMVKKVEELIKNKKLRKKMSNKCIQEVREGKFSMKKRNEKLKQIYAEATK
jgi:glycosyltransferase involved in cell wall biosynthesis